MRSVSDLLRDADPVRHEPDDRREARDRLRAVVVAAASQMTQARTPRLSRPAIAVSVLVALAIAIVAVGSKGWYGGTATLQAAVRFEVRLAQTESMPGLQQVRIAGSDKVLYLRPEALVTNDDILESHIVARPDGRTFDIAITFNAAGAKRMEAATRSHAGQPLAILIDGEVVMAPVIRATITDQALITGNYTRAEAERIANGVMLR